MNQFGFIILSLFLVTACSHQKAKDSAQESQRFNAFLDQTFDEYLSYSPESLSSFGKKDHYDKLDDHSEAFRNKMHELEKQKLQMLSQFDRNSLDPQSQLTYDLFKSDLEHGIADFQWKDYYYPVNQQHGVHTNLPTFMITIHKVETEKDLQDYISRLNEFHRVFNEVIEQIKRAEKAGIVPPQFVYPSVFTSAKNVIKDAPFEKSKKDSPLFADFKSKLKSLKLSAEKNKEYTQKAEKALMDNVRPSYLHLIAVMKDQQARATKDDGAWKFPRGEEFYNTRLQRFTTTNMTADQIHELGLKNVARLRADMEAIKAKLKFKGTLPDFFKAVRKDPKQYFPNTEAGKKAYLAQSNKYMEDINKKVPNYFHLLPVTKMEVRAVEKFREEGAGKAFYEGPSDDGKRPGVYYVNLRDLKDAPKFESEALFYHEGIPGHHFQIALGIELKNLPKVRRYGHYTAFVEGWGLYAERLGKEMGGYTTDSAELGRLSMEMTRACRLVVDTGIHAKKWTREKAIAFMNENLPLSAAGQTEQIERYIIWPGQATAYMVGMLKIVELRELAEKELGSKFDIREFHDVVLGNGALSLEVLEKVVKNYIQDKKKA